MSTSSELAAWQDHLEAALPQDGSQPMIVRVYQETRSTQDIAKTFAPRKALIVADQQTQGRGRLGRSWLSTPGASVLMSVCWPIEDIGTTHDRVSLLVGVAIARAVEQLAPDSPVRLKWPNDVLVNQKKIAGVLIEGSEHTFIIGIGLNVTRDACPDEMLRPETTCLAELGASTDRLGVIETLFNELDRALSSANTKKTLEAWRTHAALGQTQTFEHNNQRITGDVIDLDPDHGLIVRRDTGEIVTLPAATTSVVK